MSTIMTKKFDIAYEIIPSSWKERFEIIWFLEMHSGKQTNTCSIVNQYLAVTVLQCRKQVKLNDITNI